MDLFEDTDFRLLHLAARFRPKPETTGRNATTAQVAVVANALLADGFYADELVSLDDPTINFFEMLPILSRFLGKLCWTPFTDRQEFLFLTAYYAKVGSSDDVAAYHAMQRWMKDVGRNLHEEFSVNAVANTIGDSVNTEFLM